MKRRLSTVEKLFLLLPITGALLVWKSPNLRRAWKLQFPNRTITPDFPVDTAQFSPDGKFLLLASPPMRRFNQPGNKMHVETALWEIATGIRVWQTATERKIKTSNISTAPPMQPQLQPFLKNVRFSKDSTATFDNSASFLLAANLPGPQPKWELWSSDFESARFLDHGRLIVRNGAPPYLLDAKTGNVVTKSVPITRFPTLIRIAQDGKTAIFLQNREDSQWQARYFQSLKVNSPQPTDRYLQRLEVWDLAAAHHVRTFPKDGWGNNGNTNRLFALSPDGKTTAIADLKRSGAELWNTDTGRLRHTLTFPASAHVDTFWFSPDSRFLLTQITERAGADNVLGQIVLFDCRTARRLWTRRLFPVGAAIRGMHSVSFSRDSHSLIVTDGEKISWIDVATGRTQNEKVAHGVIFSPDGKTMALSTRSGVELQSAP